MSNEVKINIEQNNGSSYVETTGEPFYDESRGSCPNLYASGYWRGREDAENGGKFQVSRSTGPSGEAGYRDGYRAGKGGC